MGKKSKRQRSTAKGASNRREAIQARRQPKDPRTEANELMEEFVRLSNDRNREIALKKYAELISNKMQESPSNALNFVTKEDRSFLMGIYRNTQEVPFFRAAAVTLWGEVSAFNCDERDAGLCMQLALKICNQSIESGPSIAALQDRCLKNLDGWRNNNNAHWHGRSKHGGDQCDYCCKFVEEYGVDFLACCGRCKLSYYCSVECQKKDWKLQRVECQNKVWKLQGGGHKEHCRKKGEFWIGDTVYHCSYADPCGPMPVDAVHLLAPVPCSGTGNGKPDKWFVSDIRHDNFDVVLAQNLSQVRSVKWWSFEDHRNKKRALKAMMELVATDASKRSTSTVLEQSLDE